MYKLYSMTSNHATIQKLALASRDLTESQDTLPSIVPQQLAPVVRVAPDGVRELVSMRWGFPSPTSSEAGLITSIRKPASHWWKGGLRIERRCLVPATSFCDYQGKPPTPHWFALGPTRSLFFIAGVWRLWMGNSIQNRLPAKGEHLIYSILVTEGKTGTSLIQPKTIPVLLLDKAERDIWLNGTLEQALALSGAMPASGLDVRVVATGQKRDNPSATHAA